MNNVKLECNKCSRLRFYLAQWELLECLIADARNFMTALESKFMALWVCCKFSSQVGNYTFSEVLMAITVVEIVVA